MESYKRNHEQVETNGVFPENSKIRKVSESSDIKQSLADPDYVFSENVQPQYSTECHQNKKARLIEIIKKEFNTEITNKEREIEEIEDRLKIAVKTLQLLRTVCISSFYNRQELVTRSFNDAELKLNDPKVDTVFGPQTRPHPAVKKIIGKAPIQLTPTRTRQIRKTHSIFKNGYVNGVTRAETIENSKEKIDERISNDPGPSTSTNTSSTIVRNCPLENGGVRNERFKTKHTIIIGNISKWLNPSDTNPDKSTHKWMVYVRGPKDKPDISHIVRKVRFFLHPSYRPNDIIEIKSPPFHLSRRGWGEFPLRAQIHFTNHVNKPIDVIHNLKLDRTHTGLETLGAETVINVWLYSKPLNHFNINSNLDETINLNDEEFDESDEEEVDSKDFFECEETKVETDKKPIIIKQELHDHESVPNSRFSLPESQNHVPNEPNPIPETQTLPTSSSKVYFKDGKICLLKNRTRVANKPKNNVSLLKNSVCNKYDIKPNLENNLILVTVRGIHEIHDYCKKIDPTPIKCPKVNYDYFLSKFSKLKFNDIVTALLYLLRHLPLISSNAREPHYLKMFPYTAVSIREFLSWSKIKQFCSEWYRAKTIKNLLVANKIIDHEKWSTKSILKFARMSGFGVNFDSKNNSTPQKTIPHNIKNRTNLLLKTFTESDELKPYLNQLSYSIDSDSEDINVIDDETPHIGKKIKEEIIPPEQIVHFTENDTKINVSSNFVKEVVSELGISLGLEEMFPDCWGAAAEVCVLVATKCLAEDLIRRSLVSRSVTCDESNELKLEHVKSALLGRPEFDIFLNYGLGRRY